MQKNPATLSPFPWTFLVAQWSRIHLPSRKRRFFPRVRKIKGNGNSLHYSCLGNPTDRGARQATVLGIAESYRTEHADMLPCQNRIKLNSEDPSFPQYVQSLGVTGAR